MPKLLMWLATILCPGIIFLMSGKIFSMIIAFALQISILGWIPAIIWARKTWQKEWPEKLPTKTSPPQPPPKDPKSGATS